MVELTDPVTDGRPLRILIVSTWFPSVDDTSKGRFVADQAIALAMAGADPAVVSFSALRLRGVESGRRTQVTAARRVVAQAIASRGLGLFAPRGWAVEADVPIARVSVVQGEEALDGPLHKLTARSAVLGPLADAIRGWRPDVIHAHTLYPDGAAAMRLADLLDCPLVVTEHAHFVDSLLAVPAIRAEIVAVVDRAIAVLCVGEGLATVIADAIPGAPDKIRILPNAVDMDAFQPVPLDRRTPDQLLAVGQRTPVKGVDVLLRATAIARAKRPRLTLRMIGGAPGPDVEASWRRLAADLGIADIVTFEPPALRSAVAAAMQSASVLVHASRRETFGVVPVEALACGLPVVATATDGVAETMRRVGPGAGTLVAIGDVEALAAAIVDVLERRPDYEPSALRQAVESQYGYSVVANELLRVYGQRHPAPQMAVGRRA